MKWRPEFIPSPDPCELLIFSLTRARLAVVDGGVANYYRAKEHGQQGNLISVTTRFYTASGQLTQYLFNVYRAEAIIKLYNESKTTVIKTETYSARQQESLLGASINNCPEGWDNANVKNAWEAIVPIINANSTLVEVVSDAQAPTGDGCYLIYHNEKFLSGGDGPPLDPSVIRTGPFEANVLIQHKENSDGTIQQYVNEIYTYNGDIGKWIPK